MRHLLQNPKLQQMAICSSNHSLDLYLSKSLGPFKNHNIELALNNANSVNELLQVEKAFRALVCQMCGNYFKTKSEIMKQY